MNDRILDIVHSDAPPSFFSVGQGLLLMSYLYKALTNARVWLYNKNLLVSKKMDCPVISIGNITAGGTGKTPMAVFLAHLCKDMGFRPLVLSRGYKGRLSSKGGMVSDGRTVFMTAEDAGDEPYMMARQMSFPVFIGRDRYKTGILASRSLRPDVIILDDGFQHIKLQRDLDIVLMDARKPLGSNRLLPAGNLREPLSSCLKRADVFIFTRCPVNIETPCEQIKIPPEITRSETPCFYARHIPYLCRYVPNTPRRESKPVDPLQLSGMKILVFSGIANNRAFKTDLENMGMIVLLHLEFNDHYRYKEADFLTINRMAGQVGADIIVTTEKDYAKFDHEICFSRDLAVMGIRIELTDRMEIFKTLIKETIQS